MVEALRNTVGNKAGGISETGYLRQTGDGYILTDCPWNNIDTAIVVKYSAPTMSSSGNKLCVASVSNNNITASQIGDGNAHAWTVIYQDNPDAYIGLMCGNGSGAVYRFFRDPGTFVKSPDANAPVFNTMYYTPYNGWRSDRALSVNGTWDTSSFFGGGTSNTTFPTQPVALFAHANPSNIISAYGGVQRIFRVHSVAFLRASTGDTIREFVAAQQGETPGMFDVITKNFFPASGSFVYEDMGGTFV